MHVTLHLSENTWPTIHLQIMCSLLETRVLLSTQKFLAVRRANMRNGMNSMIAATKSKSCGNDTTADEVARNNVSAAKFAFPVTCRTSVVNSKITES